MTRKKARKTLAACFKALPKADLERLRFHLIENTPILCGKTAFSYTDGKGGG